MYNYKAYNNQLYNNTVPEVGSKVLCCWPDSGWYYKASVLGIGNSESSWNVRRESGETSDIPISHIINITSSNIIHVSVAYIIIVIREFF